MQTFLTEGCSWLRIFGVGHVDEEALFGSRPGPLDGDFASGIVARESPLASQAGAAVCRAAETGRTRPRRPRVMPVVRRWWNGIGGGSVAIVLRRYSGNHALKRQRLGSRRPVESSASWKGSARDGRRSGIESATFPASSWMAKLLDRFGKKETQRILAPRSNCPDGFPVTAWSAIHSRMKSICFATRKPPPKRPAFDLRPNLGECLPAIRFLLVTLRQTAQCRDAFITVEITRSLWRFPRAWRFIRSQDFSDFPSEGSSRFHDVPRWTVTSCHKPARYGALEMINLMGSLTLEKFRREFHGAPPFRSESQTAGLRRCTR